MHAWATVAWVTLACGAGAGFVARDVLSLPPAWVARGWLAGALAALATLVTSRVGRGGRSRRGKRPCAGPREGAGPAEGARAPAGGGRVPAAAVRAAAQGGRGQGPRGEVGQATVESTALVLVVALVLGALLGAGRGVDGRSFGGFVAHRLVCAATGGCRDGDGALARAYGSGTAALVREHAPNLTYEPGERQIPVDWRRCRRRRCANAPDARGLDVHRSRSGGRATVFTRVLRRGGRTYIQYWFYFPDSNTTWAGSDKLWELAWLLPKLRGLIHRTPPYPGFHRDDWEGYAVRLDPDGSAWVRASSHGHWQGCKERDCEGEWTRRTGWTRVSRGSHAGHIPMRTDVRRRTGPIDVAGGRYLGFVEVTRRRTPLLPGRDLDERTTTSEGLRLVPLETHDRRRYRSHAEGVGPPWTKDAYRNPESERS